MLCVCLIYDACSLRRSWTGSIFVSSCRCCVFVSHVHPAAVTHVTFHMRNKEAKLSLKVVWNSEYLGVTLDRTLGYKHHKHNTHMKVAIYNLLGKLSNSKWGANASTIRTTALTLSYSIAEYASPVWARSSHAQKLDT